MISEHKAFAIRVLYPTMTFEEFREQGLSDGCTGVPDFDIRECCEWHDYKYVFGKMSRKAADRRFRLCIQRKAKGKPWWKRPMYQALAWTYWVGVRAFGWNRHQDKSKK